MNAKEFLTVVLPLFVVALFFKLYFSALFLIYPGDIIFALVLTILIFKSSGILLYTFLFFLGLLEGLDFLNIELLSAIYFVLLGILINHLRKYLTFETLESKIIIWILSILTFLIFRYIVYFCNLNVPIDWMWILNLAVKSFYYVFTTFIWVLIFYKILINFLYKRS